MALEISTAGVSLKYCVETTAGTRPTASYTDISGIKETPDFNPEPSTLEVTDLSDTVWKRYIAGLKDPGGALSSAGGHTVFAQVIDGMDVVDKIAAVKVNSETNKPDTDVVLKSVEITTYKAQ